MRGERTTRERILTEARRLFAERGFSGTSTAEIEQAAGLSPRSGALYKHFASKQALFEAALEERMRDIDAMRAQIEMVPLADLRSELTVIGRWVIAEMERERELARLVMREGDRHPELAERFRDAIVRRGQALATEVLKRYVGQSAETLPDPEAAAEVLCSSIVGYCLQEQMFGEGFVAVDHERFVAAWVEATAATVEKAERSATHA